MHSIQFPLQTTEDESTLAPSQIQSKIHSRFKETIFIFDTTTHMTTSFFSICPYQPREAKKLKNTEAENVLYFNTETSI